MFHTPGPPNWHLAAAHSRGAAKTISVDWPNPCFRTDACPFDGSLETGPLGLVQYNAAILDVELNIFLRVAFVRQALLENGCHGKDY